MITCSWSKPRSRDQRLRQAPEALKEELLESPDVVHVAGAALLPGGPVGRTSFQATSAPLVSVPATLSMPCAQWRIPFVRLAARSGRATVSKSLTWKQGE